MKNISIVTQHKDNSLCRTLLANYGGVSAYSTLDEALEAVGKNGTVGIMLLADGYPSTRTVITAEQAARISDQTAFFLLGDMVECGRTEELFSMPKDKRTEDYITGRFG